MKRILTALVALGMAVCAFTACGDNDDTDEKNDRQVSETVSDTDEQDNGENMEDIANTYCKAVNSALAEWDSMGISMPACVISSDSTKTYNIDNETFEKFKEYIPVYFADYENYDYCVMIYDYACHGVICSDGNSSGIYIGGAGTTTGTADDYDSHCLEFYDIIDSMIKDDTDEQENSENMDDIALNYYKSANSALMEMDEEDVSMPVCVISSDSSKTYNIEGEALEKFKEKLTMYFNDAENYDYCFMIYDYLCQGVVCSDGNDKGVFIGDTSATTGIADSYDSQCLEFYNIIDSMIKDETQ
ncbi:MAG: hypothetical protein K2J08_04045 [Ruminococcus sp.]|nr:hypothetical protein [Ruminococcus sp.]